METEIVVLLVTTVATVAGSALVVIQVMLAQMNKLEERIDGRFTRLEGRLDAKFSDLEGRSEDRFTRLEGKFDAMGRDVSDTRERVARIEGHLMAPGGFTPRRTQPAAADEPTPEDPAPDRRQAS